MPVQALVHVGSATDVVARRIALAPEDVDEPGSDASHGGVFGIFRTSVEGVECLGKSVAESSSTQLLRASRAKLLARTEVRLR